MWDFLTFNRFITQDVLIFFYYTGALVVPFILFFSRDYLVRNIAVFKTLHEKSSALCVSFPQGAKILLWIGFIMMFFSMELCWRMLFEVMIGYFDMHDYMHRIVEQMPHDL